MIYFYLEICNGSFRNKNLPVIKITSLISQNNSKSLGIVLGDQRWLDVLDQDIRLFEYFKWFIFNLTCLICKKNMINSHPKWIQIQSFTQQNAIPVMIWVCVVIGLVLWPSSIQSPSTGIRSRSSAVKKRCTGK